MLVERRHEEWVSWDTVQGGGFLMVVEVVMSTFTRIILINPLVGVLVMSSAPISFYFYHLG